MFEAIRDLFRIPDLKNRIVFTLIMLAIYRFGAHIPTPGVDTVALGKLFAHGGVLGFLDIFAGGALRRFSIMALGVIPYINASIIMQLLTVVVPAIEKLSKEGEEGRKKITIYTRYATVFLAAIQAFGMSYWLQHLGVLRDTSMSWRLMMVVTLTAGSVLLMWIGEQISDRGVGNGISLIIFAGIVARMPSAITRTVSLIKVGEMNSIVFILFILVIVAVVAGIVTVEEAQRRIPVQYAKRVVGRKIYGGQSTFIPLKVDQSGVIPIIFASSVLLFPATVSQFFTGDMAKKIAYLFSPSSVVYVVLYAALIIFFAYFYTAIIFNPTEMADNMKKYGGFILGIRPGRPTAEYIDKVLARITLGGAVFLAGVAVLPLILTRAANITTFYFGGTSLLIMVGVALETVHQIEAQLIMRHYEGFMRKQKGRPLFRI